jgi:hypothetical protein
MKKITICTLVLLIVLAGVASVEAKKVTVSNAEQISQQAFQQGAKAFVSVFNQIYRLFMRLSLPHSLNSLYNGSTPETPSGSYIPEMFALAGGITGITTNVQEGDMKNATIDFNQFKAQYQKGSNMVPEWKGYWNINLVNKLGKDLNDSNISAVFADVGGIGQQCSNCHENEMPQVWAKYYWKDFDSVNVSTPEGNLTWTDAMTKYLDGSFSGIGSDIMEGKQQNALNNSILFENMMQNFKQACNECHKTPRYYYVSDDVMTNITQMKTDIQNGDLSDAQAIQQQLGEEVCGRCHRLHMPAQDMKAKMGK